MIITFATQKGGAGKTTLAIAFSNYLKILNPELEINVYDYDYQRSFYEKWKTDKLSERPPLYDVKYIDDTNPLSIEQIWSLEESDAYTIIDLPGSLDIEYMPLLMYSNYIIIPFEYSDVSTHSTLTFNEFLNEIDTQSERIFIRSKYDKSYNYVNQLSLDEKLKSYGLLIKNPVYKRNILQKIDTTGLNYDQKYAIRKAFNEIIEKIKHDKSII